MIPAGESVDMIQTVSTEWLLERSRMLLAEYWFAVDEREFDAAAGILKRAEPVVVELKARGYETMDEIVEAAIAN